MSKYETPDEVQDTIRKLSNQISKGVPIFTQRLEAFLTADAAFEVAYARAFVAAECPQSEKKYRAVIATEEERAQRDVAKVALEYAKYTLGSLEKELGAYQSINKSINTIYGAVGVAER